MRSKHARKIRAAILRAKRFGWRKPPRLWVDNGALRYADDLDGRAWEHTMRKLGHYPPFPKNLRIDAD